MAFVVSKSVVLVAMNKIDDWSRTKEGLLRVVAEGSSSVRVGKLLAPRSNDLVMDE